MQKSNPDNQLKASGRMYNKPIAEYTTAEVGREGENIVRQYLTKRGYTIRATNLKIGGVEIDVLADSNQNDQQNDKNTVTETVLIEVKTRVCLHKEDVENYPEYAVNKNKQQRYLKAAKVIENCFEQVESIRFDVISIQIMSESLARIHHIIGAFEADE
ncbi:YraN family protein [Atopobium fossor]|uniref:YraN family protein n=1 Tax=Atopobium fossor TaxID=39487 RepID=UPI0004151F1C|nr:YraN family protein [Atopobium fossor]